MKRHKTVDAFIENSNDWKSELIQLRKILNTMDLVETVKWGAPVYVANGKNVVGLGAFKSYVGLWFFQGALLSDPQKVLMNAGEGKTKAMRQWRFDSKKDIKTRAIKLYVNEAIDLAEQGKEIKPDRNKPIVVPPEMKKAMTKNKKANTQFEAMTIGKQREYAEYIADAKREETKLKRIEKILPMIAQGKGLNDKYRNC